MLLALLLAILGLAQGVRVRSSSSSIAADTDPFTPEYYGKECPDGTAILNQDDCELAALSLRQQFASPITSEKRPYGCFEDKHTMVYFNTLTKNETGNVWKNSRGVCNTPTPSPTAGPTTCGRASCKSTGCSCAPKCVEECGTVCPDTCSETTCDTSCMFKGDTCCCSKGCVEVKKAGKCEQGCGMCEAKTVTTEDGKASHTIDADCNRVMKDSEGNTITIDSKGNKAMRDSTGAMYLRDSTGNWYARDNSGNKLVRDTSGNWRAQDADGNMLIKDAEGNWRAQDADGNMMIKDKEGNWRAQDADGIISWNRG